MLAIGSCGLTASSCTVVFVGEFVTDCADHTSKKTVCRRIRELADGYGIRSVAEGVETTADLLAVCEMGFDLAQGFLFAKPMKAKKFARKVLSRQMAV